MSTKKVFTKKKISAPVIQKPVSPFRRPRGAKDVHATSWSDVLKAGTEDVRRLDSVTRFSSIPVTFSETTTTHSYWVTLYSLMIWQVLEAHGWKGGLPDLGEVLRYAVSHDAPESVTGDVVRTLKYSSRAMKKAVDEAEVVLVERLMAGRVRAAISFVPSPAAKAIVKAADWFALWQFMRREAARMNLEIIPFYNRMVRDLQEAEISSPPELQGLYAAIIQEVYAVRMQCFGRLAEDPRWNREV